MGHRKHKRTWEVTGENTGRVENVGIKGKSRMSDRHDRMEDMRRADMRGQGEVGPQEHTGQGKDGEARVHVEIKGHGEDVVHQEDMGFGGTQGTRSMGRT